MLLAALILAGTSRALDPSVFGRFRTWPITAVQDQHFRLLVRDGLCRRDDGTADEALFQRIRKVVKKVAADLTSDHEDLPIAHPRQYWEKHTKQRANAVVLGEIFRCQAVQNSDEPQLTRAVTFNSISESAIRKAKATTGIKRR